MDWVQVWTLAGTNLALIMVSLGVTVSLFTWSRSEAAHDRRFIQGVMEENIKENALIIREIREEIKEIRNLK